MKTDEDILFEIYYASELNQYHQIKSAFENKDFEFLRVNGHPYIKVTRKENRLQSCNMDEVIKELQQIKEGAQPNESFFTVSGEIVEDENEPAIFVDSIVFDLLPISMCEREAKSTIKWNMWKIKNQPNGKDAKRIREKIEKYKDKFSN